MICKASEDSNKQPQSGDKEDKKSWEPYVIQRASKNVVYQAQEMGRPKVWYICPKARLSKNNDRNAPKGPKLQQEKLETERK